MAETALDDLLALTRDPKVSTRNKLSAAISASRVSPLVLPGEELPEAIKFLRYIIDFRARDGSQFSAGFRREAAAGLAYWQRRAQKMVIEYDVSDQAELRVKWTRIVNGALRFYLNQRGLWPRRKDVLFDRDDLFELPAGDPDRTLMALQHPVAVNRHEKRRRAVDDPGGPATIGSEAERLSIIRPIARLVLERLAKFGLAPKGQRVDGLRDGSAARLSA